MTPKQNLLAAFAHTDLEWIPWIPVLGGVNTPNFVPPEIKVKADEMEVGLFLQKELGCDLLMGAGILAGGYQTAKVNTSHKDDVIIEELEIGGNILRKVTQTFLYGDQETSHIAEYPVKTLDDMRALECLTRDSFFNLASEDWERKVAVLGERGVVSVGGARTPIMELILSMMGLDNFINALYDYPEEMRCLMETMHEANLARYRAIATTKGETVSSGEDFSTLLISPDMFRRHVLPVLKEYADICHQAGKYFYVHSCGHILDFMPMFLESGIDALHYMTSPPIGNTPVKTARQIWKDKITVMAAVNPVMLERESDETVARHVRTMLSDSGPKRSFILMTSSKPTIPEKNLRVIAEIMRQGRSGQSV